MATSIPLSWIQARCLTIEGIRLPAVTQTVHGYKREKAAERTHIFRGSKQQLFCNYKKMCAMKGFGASQIWSFLYSDSKTGEKEQVDAAEDKEKISPFTYSFRTDTSGHVKVSVWSKNESFVVFIEVSPLSEGTDDQKLVLKWSKIRFRSSVSMVKEVKSSSPHTEDSFFTPFAKKLSGGYEVELEFDSHEKLFYLSFLLLASSKSKVESEVQTHRKTNFCVPLGFGSGYPAPSGVSFCNDGSVNFSVFSRNAESVILCLYTDDKGSDPALEIELDPYINRTGDMWHVWLKDINSYVSYGYKCKGKGDGFDSQRVLLDPYAKILGSFYSNEEVSASLTKCLGLLCEEPSFDWEGEVRPKLPMEKLMVYRLSVGRFTEDKSSKLPGDVAGTFLGVIQKLHHFKSLGINAILLEPILPFDEKKGPYLPYHFFSPVTCYSPMRDGLSARNSLKEMVKILHANAVEVLMEVVFTQTAEGIDTSSKTISYRGIDNSSYYIVSGDVGTETGNALNCNHPVVQRTILDSLRHWVTEFHVDGFCFVDASSLCRGSNGKHLSRPPLVEAIAFDPVLSKTKIIADCWVPLDMAHGGIKFPHWKRWAEMNSRFCQDVRNFLRGKGLLSSIATRLCGSGDIFSDGRGPSFSFNFIAKNFGLSLVDLVSFSSQELSPELSWNCGEEGPTNKSTVLETRLKQIRNFLFVLFVSLGVPVLNMGDECGHSTGGSSSFISRKPFDWGALKSGYGIQITEFIEFMSKLRIKRNDLLQSRNFLKEDNIVWQANDQSQPHWEDPDCKFVAMTLKSENDDKSDLFVAINASDTLQNVILPEIPEGNTWVRLIDTALSFPGFFSEDGVPVVKLNTGINTFSHTPSKEWFQTSAVLRVSLGNFLFFAIFSLIMIGVKNENDKRYSWHHGGWMAKIVIWALLIVLMFFIPNVVITVYEILSKFGSGFFLLVQVLLLLDFTHTWNDAWAQRDEQKWYIALLVVSVVCYLATYSFSAVLFIWFNPSGHECGLNVFFITLTMVLAFVFAVIALHPKVHGSLLPASVISVYCAYLCYSGLSSEPRDYACNGLHKHSKGVSTGTLVLGMVTTVLSVIYLAVRAGSSTALLSPPSSPKSGAKDPLLESDVESSKNEKKDSEAKPVSYNYTFFHLIFALASMYSAMLLTGWSSSTSGSSQLIDVGWTSVWVRICTEWVTAALYIWSLLAPLIFPDRDFT